MKTVSLLVATFALLLGTPSALATPVGCADVVVNGEAEGDCLAVAVLGTASGRNAIVVFGDADGDDTGIAAFGHASGMIAVVLYGCADQQDMGFHFDPHCEVTEDGLV